MTDDQKLLVNTERLVEAERVLAEIEEAIVNEEEVSAAKTALSVTINDNTLTLQTKGLHNTTVTWNSSDSSTVDPSTGKVKRPFWPWETKTVTLTATFTKGKAKETQKFTVSVPASGIIKVTKN